MPAARVSSLRLGPRRGRTQRAGGPVVRRAFAGGSLDEEREPPRARGLGELLDEACDAYAAEFALCVGFCVALWFPFELLGEFLVRSGVGVRDALVLLGVSIPARALCIGFVACFVADRLLGREPRPGRAVSRALSSAGRLVVTSVAVLVVTVPLACMCFAPILLGMWLLSLAPVVVALERTGVLAGMRRSVRLTVGWPYLGRWVGIVVVSTLLFLPVTGLTNLLQEPFVRSSIETAFGARGIAFDLTVGALAAFFVGLASAFSAVAMAVYYVDSRVRKEGLDLEAWLERLVAGHPIDRAVR